MYPVICTTRVNEDSGDRRFGGCLNAGMGLRIRITNRMVTSGQRIRTPGNQLHENSRREAIGVFDNTYVLPHSVQ